MPLSWPSTIICSSLSSLSCTSAIFYSTTCFSLHHEVCKDKVAEMVNISVVEYFPCVWKDKSWNRKAPLWYAFMRKRISLMIIDNYDIILESRLPEHPRMSAIFVNEYWWKYSNICSVDQNVIQLRWQVIAQRWNNKNYEVEIASTLAFSGSCKRTLSVLFLLLNN